MASIRDPIPVKLICGMTFTSDVNVEEIIKRLEINFSPIEIQSPVFDFSAFTAYYQEEMGTDLRKQFFCFQGLYDPINLASSKVRTTEIENAWSEGDKRKINLDPGYITAAKLVLASTKDFTHRIYLSQGIYGDVQYCYKQGQFEMTKWTYPDYKTDLAIQFFNQVRQTFIQQEKTNAQIIQL